MLYSSFKNQWQIYANPYALPRSLDPANYIKAWKTGDFKLFFTNSVIVTVPSVVGLIVISSLAAYSFARYKFKGDKFLFLFFLFGIMVPPQAIVIPAFQVVYRLHLLNNYLGLIFTYLGWCSFGIFILRTFFSSFPKEIEDAAKMDGCSSFGIFLRIAFPLAKPALATVSIFYFVWVWNDFLYPLLYLQRESMNTIPLGLMLFQGRYLSDWSMQTAALSIATIIPIIFYLIFQDKFVKGLTAGAVKG
jgi:ABC-type glycerol-3-phosphate transport system permease component